MPSKRSMAWAIATMKADLLGSFSKLKAPLTVCAGAVLVTACATNSVGLDPSETPADPVPEPAQTVVEAEEIEDPSSDSLVVSFEANSDLEDGQCNPKVHYALRTDEEVILLNANFEVVGHNLSGSGLALFKQEDSEFARNSGELNMFDSYPLACSELQVRVMDLSCRLEDENDSKPCPDPVYEGTEMFGSFRGLPNY